MKIFGGLNKYFASEQELAADPVCGMRVVKNEELKTEVAGKVYYFCSPGCLEQFEKNPESYLKI